MTSADEKRERGIQNTYFVHSFGTTSMPLDDLVSALPETEVYEEARDVHVFLTRLVHRWSTDYFYEPVSGTPMWDRGYPGFLDPLYKRWADSKRRREGRADVDAVRSEVGELLGAPLNDPGTVVMFGPMPTDVHRYYHRYVLRHTRDESMLAMPFFYQAFADGPQGLVAAGPLISDMPLPLASSALPE